MKAAKGEIMGDLYAWANQELTSISGVTISEMKTVKPSRFLGIELGSPKQQFDVCFRGPKFVGTGAQFTVTENPGSSKVKITSVVDTIGLPVSGSASWAPERIKDHLIKVANHAKRGHPAFS